MSSSCQIWSTCGEYNSTITRRVQSELWIMCDLFSFLASAHTTQSYTLFLSLATKFFTQNTKNKCRDSFPPSFSHFTVQAYLVPWVVRGQLSTNQNNSTKDTSRTIIFHHPEDTTPTRGILSFLCLQMEQKYISIRSSISL